MVARQTVVSPMFARRGKLSPAMLSRLMVRGGGANIDDALRRFGWTFPEPVLTTVATVAIESGVITAMRFESRGELPLIRFRAEDLWVGAEQNIGVSIKVTDLSVLAWSWEGLARNQTNWIDGSEVALKITKQDGVEITEVEDMEEAGIGGLAMRFTVLPMTVDRALLYAGVVPYSMVQLRTKLDEVGKGLGSSLVPTVAVKLSVVKGKPQNGLPIMLAPQEVPGDRVGMGHFPLLEIIGAGNPVFPDHNKLEAEVHAI